MKTEERDEPLNPYAAPQWTETAAETVAASPMPDAERPGVPWEQPGPLNRRFFATTWLMYTAPRQFFQRMRLNGGIWMPALFNVLAVILAMLVLIAILELANGPGFAAARGDCLRLLSSRDEWRGNRPIVSIAEAGRRSRCVGLRARSPG